MRQMADSERDRWRWRWRQVVEDSRACEVRGEKAEGKDRAVLMGYTDG